ncbi:GNAT family N-acetyltransferase [Marixanthomonas ophiurae]|uniref:GNAT family N-acetyltransferase n=1 Tax=Marixanthomonas ophiurae TaxID=387659 RepID=A0A3E1QCH9_9FLAO|nr:GNAT family N-acetyltransferase [Marixanthomonas ophiurae]RFN59850.1 GNAT family N-acetyltransferase [Marixanthomonas ophiurae]
MKLSFGIIPPSEILIIIPLLQKLEENTIPESVSRERVLAMSKENYECLGIYDLEKLIGICGLWFQTRHYAGKSMELDHVYIDNEYQSKGVGKKLMEFVTEYAVKKECNWLELNTYVHNFASHKFYYNQGFVAKGYHFVKEL